MFCAILLVIDIGGPEEGAVLFKINVVLSVWILICVNITIFYLDGKEAEGVEENIWIEDGRGNGGMEEIA